MNRNVLRHALLFVSAAFASAAVQAAPDSTATVWFEVGSTDPEFPESYLLPLEDPEAIAQARARIASGEASGVGSIVLARIAAGGDGLNRNLRKPGAPRWNWHVEEFLGFADVAMEICDGWPGYIAENTADFIANTDGTLCLWGYRLQRELESAPQFVPSSGLDGIWHTPELSGQGLVIDVLPDSNLVTLGWFTWSPEGGKQAWYTAAGNLQPGTVELTVMQPEGGAFEAPATVTAKPVGSARITFRSCSEAEFMFDFGPQQGAAVRQLKRYDTAPDCSR